MRALVGLDRLEIRHVAEDRVFVGDAVCAEDVAGQAGAFEGHPDVVALGHGDVLEAGFVLVFEAADLQHEQLRLGDLVDHPRQFFLNQLMRRDRLVVELLAEERLLQRAVVAGHGGADSSP